MTFKPLVFSVSAVLILTACQSAPIGWGGTHKVMMANSKVITVMYDPVVRGYEDALAEAVSHCQKFKKEPVPLQEGRANVMYPTLTFECR